VSTHETRTNSGLVSGQTVDLVDELSARGVDVIDCSTGGLTGVPAVAGPPVGYGYQVPYAEIVRARTGVPTMAVGHIVHPEQADAIIAGGRADLVALGRELLHHPNWPLDAARRLGVPDPYEQIPRRTAHWLRKRDGSFDGFAPSTDGRVS
jgi:2,4-dienoyl-CoA reductase-like NADH-dependent reductase (Old Yellow Enzyme family)